MSSINWSDLVKEAGETASYEPLPDGDYDLKVIAATATTTQTGKTMFKITTEVQSGPFAKRRIWDNLTVTTDNPKALGMFFRKMAALGLPREYFNQNPSNAQVEAALMSRSFRAQIGSRVWQGDKKNEIKMYYVLPTTDAGTPAAAAPAAAPAPAPVAAPAPAAATPFEAPVVAAPPAPVAAAPAPAPAPAPAAPVDSSEPF